MEADLARYYATDLRDYWRRDREGRRRLSARRLSVLVTQLPLDSAVARAVNGGVEPWRREHHLLDDIRLVLQLANTEAKKRGQVKPAPDRPDARSHKAEQRARDPRHQAKRRAALRRKREREAAIAAGAIT